MRVVLAPDKFKGSLTAAEVAGAVADGIRRVFPDVETVVSPAADGGEGTVEAALGSGYERRTVQVTGPIGEPVTAEYAVSGEIAVIEMALASGLGVLPHQGGRPVLDGLGSTSRGTGEVIRHALDAGCRTIVLGVGGSANSDGGAGMLAALGLRLLDEAGADVPPGVGGLGALARVDAAGLDSRLANVQFVLASDVDNPLTGERGAAAVFGPQKGLSAEDVPVADAHLARWRDALADALGEHARAAADHPGAGAAGGVGYAALVLGAERRPGIDVVLELVGLADRIAGADLVITGEGSLDEQSLMGKTPIGVADLARRAGVPVVAVCGRTTLTDQQIAAAGFAGCYPLTAIEPDVERCIDDAGTLLVSVGEQIATDGHLTSDQT